jgi:CRISPR-associated endonuclease/helicase Cas3
MAIDVLVSKFELSFADTFLSLTGNPPYPWQQKLYRNFLSAIYPNDINLPTGSGKTSIMAIWLAALAHEASQPMPHFLIPRRLVWVVDRRVVVDQATSEAEQLAKRVNQIEASPALRNVRDALASLSSVGEQEDVLAISTLRGEKEDNRAWSRNPSCPAIIVGTVDMIGSRLLFSGYGDKPYRAAQHAGLLGQDAIVVNDEAHLTPAFAALLNKLERLRYKHIKPFKTIRLSATNASTKCWPESLEEDRSEPKFRSSFESSKGLAIRALPAAKLDGTALELAMTGVAERTLIFVKSPEKVRRFADALAKRGVNRDHIRVLTGTMRGFERDQLTKSEVFQAFAARERPTASYWLVATSAAEVGVNISADTLITDLDTLDHLLQRFGRLNRFGETHGMAHLLANETEKDERLNAALAFLRSLPTREDGTHDISPSALFGLHLPESALSETPLEAPLHDWHIEVWSQTSLGRHPARPAVEPWLHGKQDNLPETYLAWREDVPYLTSDAIDSDDRENALDTYRLLAHEQLREPSKQLLEKLEELARKPGPNTKFLVRKKDGGVDVRNIAAFLNLESKVDRDNALAGLAYGQILLPPGCGRLDGGMFSPEWNGKEGGEAGEPDESPYDVSAKPPYAERAVFLRKFQDGSWIPTQLCGHPTSAGAEDALANADNVQKLHEFASSQRWKFLLKAPLDPPEGEAETAECQLLYFGEAKPKSLPRSDPYWLDDHLTHVAKHAKALAEKLKIQELATAYESAGKFHDLGKCEQIWQKAAGNYDDRYPRKAVAKSIKPMRSRELNGFRHELASLQHAEERLQDQPAELRDVILHLVAAHHGHARPCFQAKAYDRRQLSTSKKAAMESARRFGRLQNRFGPWGLAYLEAIFKAADGLASADWEEAGHA